MSIPRQAEIEGQYGVLLAQVLAQIVDDLHSAPLRISGSRIYRGTGSPEGVQRGSIGDLYLRTDGSTSTTLYVKTSGTSVSGWTAK